MCFTSRKFHITNLPMHFFYTFSTTTWCFAVEHTNTNRPWEVRVTASFWIYLHKICEMLQLQARRLLIYRFTQHNENKGWTNSLTTMTWFKLVNDQSKVHPVLLLKWYTRTAVHPIRLCTNKWNVILFEGDVC